MEHLEKMYGPQTLEERQTAVRVYCLVRHFMDFHRTREVNEHLSQMFGSFANSLDFTELQDELRGRVVFTFTDMIRLMNEISAQIPDPEAQEYMKQGRDQAA